MSLRSSAWSSANGLNDVPNVISVDDRVQVAIAIGVAILWALCNCLKIDQQGECSLSLCASHTSIFFLAYPGWLNNLAAFIQISSTVSIIVTILVVTKQRTSAHDVFISTINVTGFSFPYVCFIGILPTLFSFSGFEAAGHLSEETRDAARKAPLAIIGTCTCAAVIGLAYLLSLMFASGDPLVLIQNQTNPSATVQIFQLSTPPPVALLFTILLIVNLYFAGMSSTTVSSRIGFAMARDSVFPYSAFLSTINKRTQTPLRCVLLVCAINILLLLLQLGSSTAFAAIVSISTIGFQISYMLPILFRITSSRKSFCQGYFHMGRFSVLIGCLSTAWLCITCVILLFPFNYPITAQNMNWTIVVTTGIALLAGLYWIFAARKWFVGPQRINVAKRMSSPSMIITRF